MMFIVLITLLNSIGTEVSHKEFYATGIDKSEGWLKNELKENYWKFYYSDGSLNMEDYYQQNISINFWSIYYANGQIERDGNCVLGENNGWWTIIPKEI